MKENIKSDKGITLISLVVTIIILIILAGVSINMTLGEGGIITIAKRAKENMEFAQIEEQEKLNELYTELEENGKGTETIMIEASYIGTTSFTVKIKYIDNELDVETYTYIIDDNEQITITNKEYTKEGLEAESTHKIKVIAKYTDGTTIESSILKIKLEPRTYLYNNGDTCNEITGGWKAVAIQNVDTSTKFVIPSLKFNEDYMHLYINGISEIFTGGSLIINNKINYKQYKRICFEITADMTVYNSASIISTYINSSGPRYYGCQICYSEPISSKTKFEIDLENYDNVDDIFFYVQVDREQRCITNLRIYEVWLEK